MEILWVLQEITCKKKSSSFSIGNALAENLHTGTKKWSWVQPNSNILYTLNSLASFQGMEKCSTTYSAIWDHEIKVQTLICPFLNMYLVIPKSFVRLAWLNQTYC